jgi:dimethylhistidine N-methyltransferase
MDSAPRASGPIETPELSEFRRDVLTGLSRKQKSLPGKYLWDEAGSVLFDRITKSRDYYLTARETALLREHLVMLADLIGPDASVVEFGSGASRKVRLLLDALPKPRRYVAIDISNAYLKAATASIAQDYPGLEVLPVCADYTKPSTLWTAADRDNVLGFFPGSTIGNFAPANVVSFLDRIRATLGSGWFLVGVDPNRDRTSLLRAYADEEGLMAALHGNLLARVARKLGGNLNPADFQHEARVLDNPPRVEAHLVAQRTGHYRVGNQCVSFARGESIYTDASYKYEPEFFRLLATEAGWTPVHCWLDQEGLFSIHLLRG